MARMRAGLASPKAAGGSFDIAAHGMKNTRHVPDEPPLQRRPHDGLDNKIRINKGLRARVCSSCAVRIGPTCIGLDRREPQERMKMRLRPGECLEARCVFLNARQQV